MKKTMLAILMCVVMVFGVTGCGKSDIEEAKKDLQESQLLMFWWQSLILK